MGWHDMTHSAGETIHCFSVFILSILSLILSIASALCPRTCFRACRAGLWVKTGVSPKKDVYPPVVKHGNGKFPQVYMDDFPSRKTSIWFGDFPATLDYRAHLIFQELLSDAVWCSLEALNLRNLQLGLPPNFDANLWIQQVSSFHLWFYRCR